MDIKAQGAIAGSIRNVQTASIRSANLLTPAAMLVLHGAITLSEEAVKILAFIRASRVGSGIGAVARNLGVSIAKVVA